jgi:hypothetical protein
MKFSFEYARIARENRYCILHKLLNQTVERAETGLALAINKGCFKTLIGIEGMEEYDYLLSEYETMVKNYFESYGFSISKVMPWHWVVSCDPSDGENE